MFSNRPKTLLYSQNGKAQISISSVSQTKEIITDTGNRDQVFLATPLGLFSNLPRPLSISSCVETYETCEVELWWLLLLADNFRRQNVEFQCFVAVSLSHDKKMKHYITFYHYNHLPPLPAQKQSISHPSLSNNTLPPTPLSTDGLHPTPPSVIMVCSPSKMVQKIVQKMVQ